MNEVISSKIQEIRQQFTRLKSELYSKSFEKNQLEETIEDLKIQLLNSESKNELIQKEVIDSKGLISELKVEYSELENKYKELFLHSEIQSDKNDQDVAFRSDLEIDFIVKEIDQCIEQIKSTL